MGDKNKKYIYIAVIVLSIGITAYFLFFYDSGAGGDSAIVDQLNTPLNSTAPKAAAPALDISRVEFGVPAVFPVQNKFPSNVLDSSTLKALNQYERITVSEEELKRDDPFAGF